MAVIVLRIKDHDSVVMADIEADGGKNSLFVQSNSLAKLIDDAVKAVAATPDKVLVTGGIVETTVPTAQADGKVVAVWVDESGEVWVKGYDPAKGALGIGDVAAAMLLVFADTLLNAVTGVGASATKSGLSFHHLTFHIIASGVTAGATVVIQTSLDGTNWHTAGTHVIIANGVYETKLEGKWTFVRANLTVYGDGTYSVLMLEGN